MYKDGIEDPPHQASAAADNREGVLGQASCQAFAAALTAPVPLPSLAAGGNAGAAASAAPVVTAAEEEAASWQGEELRRTDTLGVERLRDGSQSPGKRSRAAARREAGAMRKLSPRRRAAAAAAPPAPMPTLAPAAAGLQDDSQAECGVDQTEAHMALNGGLAGAMHDTAASQDIARVGATDAVSDTGSAELRPVSRDNASAASIEGWDELVAIAASLAQDDPAMSAQAKEAAAGPWAEEREAPLLHGADAGDVEAMRNGSQPPGQSAAPCEGSPEHAAGMPLTAAATDDAAMTRCRLAISAQQVVYPAPAIVTQPLQAVAATPSQTRQPTGAAAPVNAAAEGMQDFIAGLEAINEEELAEAERAMVPRGRAYTSRRTELTSKFGALGGGKQMPR